MSSNFKQADLGELDTAEPREKVEPAPEAVEEVRLNLPLEAVAAERVNIFAQRPTGEPKINIFGNCKSVNLFAISQQNQPQNGLNIFATAMATPPAIAVAAVDD
jgi:hypothetical protein